MSLNRREFIKDTAVTGAALVALEASQNLRAQSSPNEKMIVGVMGVNGRGSALARSFSAQPDAEVAYVCDVDERAIDKVTNSLVSLGAKKPQGVKDFRKLLDDKSIDVLVVAAPDHWHGPATILGCDAGKHVYVEKPACHNPREGEMMVEIARRNKCVVQMGNQRRSYPAIMEAIAKVHAGDIGRVYHSRGWYANLRGSIGKGREATVPSYLDFDLWQGPAAEKPYQDNLIHYNWHWFWNWGTGELGNNGIHALDVCRWGLEADCPTRVTSSGGRYHFDDDQQTPDTHTCSYEFEGGKSILWEGLSCNRKGLDGDTFGISFHGTDGSLFVKGPGYVQYDKGGREVAKEAGTASDAPHLANFFECIRSGEHPNSDIEGGVASTLLCHLGNIAYRTGRTINLDPKAKKIVGDDDAATLWTREYRKGWEPKI